MLLLKRLYQMICKLFSFKFAVFLVVVYLIDRWVIPGNMTDEQLKLFLGFTVIIIFPRYAIKIILALKGKKGNDNEDRI